MLYTAGIGLVAETPPRKTRQSTRQDQPDSVLGPANSQLVGKPAGVLSRAGGTQVPQRLPVRGRGRRRAQLTSFRAWKDTRPHQEGLGLGG